MKKIVCIALVALSIYSCKEDCKTCPQNYVLKNNECECESGVESQGDCESIETVRENSRFVQEDAPICVGFEDLIFFKVLTHQLVERNGFMDKNVYFNGPDISSEQGIVLPYSKDSFYAARFVDFGQKGITFKKNGGQYFEKQIKGEPCYLRCNVKVLSPRHLKYYFFFANLKDERKSDYCVRHFYQP